MFEIRVYWNGRVVASTSNMTFTRWRELFPKLDKSIQTLREQFGGRISVVATSDDGVDHIVGKWNCN